MFILCLIQSAFAKKRWMRGIPCYIWPRETLAWMCTCVCVCVCVRQRQTDRERSVECSSECPFKYKSSDDDNSHTSCSLCYKWGKERRQCKMWLSQAQRLPLTHWKVMWVVAFIFRHYKPEDEGGTFFRNIWKQLTNHTEEQARRPGSCTVMMCKPQIAVFLLLLTYLRTYLLHTAVLLEKLTGFQLVKKFPTFHGTRMFITSFTSASPLSLS